MEIASQLSNELARFLDLETRQTQLTAANMANIDTPGYRTLGIDFEAEVRRAMSGSNLGPGEEDQGAGMGLAGPRIFEVDGLIVRPDGNNVSMDRESLNLAEEQLKFKTGVALLRREYTQILDAIHADAK